MVDKKVNENIEEKVNEFNNTDAINEDELLKLLVEHYGEDIGKTYEKYKDKDVYVYIFNDDDVYLFMDMKNKEFKEINKKAHELAIMKNESPEDILKNLVVSKFVIYPELELDKLDDMEAGKFETLYELIMTASHFNTQNPVLSL